MPEFPPQYTSSNDQKRAGEQAYFPEPSPLEAAVIPSGAQKSLKGKALGVYSERIFGLMSLVFVLTACQPSGQSGLELKERSILQACPGFNESGEVAAVDNAECGTLSVLENPADPDGRRIALNIQKLPAIRAIAAEDPLFILTGGPGQAATELASYAAYLFRDVRKKRDIILVDQRGTGESNPLDCESDETEDWLLNDKQIHDKSLEVLKGCLDSYDADLRFYSTPYAMDDLDEVRRALGYKTINLWGVSYGTRAALVYARRHPDAVRSVILDASAPVQMMIPHFMEADADAALSALSSHCDNDAACVDTLGEMKEHLEAVMQRLGTEAATVTAEHPVTREPVMMLITAKRFASFVRMALYSRELGPLIPLALTQAANDDYQLFLSMVLLSSENMNAGISQGMHLAVLCNEDVSLFKRSREAGLLAEVPSVLLSTGAAESMEATCELIPKGKVDLSYFEPVKSAVPTLILSGAIDPATPPRWGELVFKHLSNARHLVASGGHHGISSLGCVPDLMAKFIELGEHESLEAECVEKIKVSPLFVDVMGPGMREVDAEVGKQ